MDLAAEHGSRDGPANDRRGDIVEERGQHEDHCQQHEPALPVVGQEARQDRGNAALFEMIGNQRKTKQQQKQVGEDDPLMRQMGGEAREPVAGLESGEPELVQRDDCEAAERHAQRVAVEQRHRSQRERKKNELDRDPGHHECQ